MKVFIFILKFIAALKLLNLIEEKILGVFNYDITLTNKIREISI